MTATNIGARYWHIRVAGKNPHTSKSKTQKNAGKEKISVTGSRTPEFLNLTNFPQGLLGDPDPNALKVRLDLSVASFDAALAGVVTIWGVDRNTRAKEATLNGKKIEIYAGKKYYNPAGEPNKQTGLIFIGTVQSAYYNHEGTENSLTLFLTAGEPRTSTNAIGFMAEKGDEIGKAANKALNDSGFKSTLFIKKDNIADERLMIVGRNLEIFNNALNDMLKSRDLNPLYIYPRNREYILTDRIKPYNELPKKIEFNDLIGQPVFNGNYTIQLQTPMRADLCVGDLIRLPAFSDGYGNLSLGNVPYDSAWAKNHGGVFGGNFVISTIRHVGESRNTSGAGWVTAIEAVTA